jgi:predicted CopG family antitoxin
MLPQLKTSNLSEALINVKKLEKNFLKHECKHLDRDRNKIRSNLDRHMETFVQLTRKRHETWYRHDKHFREALRKEKERHEKRKNRNRQKLLVDINPNFIPRVQTPFQPFLVDDVVLPPVRRTSVGKTARSPQPMTKVEQRTYQVLRESQKLLDESAVRARYTFELGRPSSSNSTKKSLASTGNTASSSCSFASATQILPMTTSIDSEEYERLVNKSLQRETFSDFVDHFVEFRPEYREQFGRSHEANKRQRAIERLREFNQIHAKNKDQRYFNLVSSLTDLPSEQKTRIIDF